MADGADERLVVMLEARISEFEKRMAKAERTGTGSYNRLRRGSQTATAQMEADMRRSTASINQALASVSTKMGTFAKAFAGGLVGGVVAGAFAGLTSNINETVKGIASIGDEAKRAGIGLQAFQEWKLVAEQNRIGVDALVDGFKELNLRADEWIVTGGGAAAEAFQRLGYSATDLKTKLKDPSALMLEIVGRLGKLDKAAQIRISDELFGGSAGERFVELLDQGEAGLRKTIDRAHELGAVMDAEMIQKAQELDRRWQELTTRVSTFGKTLALALADLPYDLVETRLNEIFDDIEGRNILGGELYESLRAMGALTDEQVESLKGLRSEYMLLADEAARTSGEMLQASDMARQFGYDQVADQLAAAGLELRQLSSDFRAGTIDGETFRTKMGEVQTKTAEALGTIAEADKVNFSTAIAQVSRLGDVVTGVAARVWNLYNGLVAASGAAPSQGIAPDLGRFGNPYAPAVQEAGPDTPRAKARPAGLSFEVDETGGYNLPSSSGGRGGKGGGGSSRLDALVEDLKTEKELLTEWYQQSLDLLNGATEAQLEALGGKHEAIERLEAEHRERMAAIQGAAQDGSLQSLLGSGADILGAIGAVNEKALKVSQVFAAAEALVSTYKGAAKELEKGVLGFPTAAAVIAKGTAFVAAINGASAGGRSSGGSAGGSAATATSAPATAPQSVTLDFSATMDPVMRSLARALTEPMIAEMQKASKTGVNIVGVRY